jgi:adenylylsulfate kinase-like enzyme
MVGFLDPVTADTPYEFRRGHRAPYVAWRHLSVTLAMPAQWPDQPWRVWLTGLSGSGRSALLNALAVVLLHTMLLDGGNVRHGLCSIWV